MKSKLFILFLSLFALHMQCGAQKQPRYVGYLFAYFEGKAGDRATQEQLYFAASADAVNWKALNNKQPILRSEEIAQTGGIRDPHLLRGHDEQGFYMVATDMSTAKNGWGPNPGIVMLKSDDLLSWSHAIIDLEKSYPSTFKDVKWVWAPQTFYDAAVGKYLVYFTVQLHHKELPDFYCAYANKEFTAFENVPQFMFSPKYGAIDGDIIYKDGTYHFFYKGHTKNEKGETINNGIQQAISSSLQGPWTEQFVYLDPYAGTKTNVEGSSVFKLNDSNQYILMYDLYSSGRYEFQRSEDLYHFTQKPESFTKDFNPRHGSVISITQEEAIRLNKKWGGVPQEMTEQIPFDNQNNPVIQGYYADPEVLYSEKTNKYYIYPTSDGFENWSGYDFRAFSSTDLKHWTDEGVILDLKKDVPWAGEKAWAPTIIEKKTNKKYTYYFYYTGANKIGVASSDEPIGPFVDSGKALIDWKPQGINRGAEIDPDVFHDPVLGKDYLYWGNGYIAMAELSKDMLSIKKETLQTFSLPYFREALEVFYRNGIYYFLYSENDTRSEDYRVRYAMSKSPTGPMTIPNDNLILSKDTEKGIYATGHNSVLKLNGVDQWRIVYHRFRRPNAINMGRSAGYHREVCMDKLEFNEDGSIKKVIPTL